MKKILYTICVVTLAATSLLGTSACKEQDWNDTGSKSESAPGIVSFRLQHALQASASGESSTRVFIAERSQDSESAADGGLYCAANHRFWMEENLFQATGLKIQWYKFSFIQVPDGISAADESMTIDSKQLFSDLFSTATETEKTTNDFTKLLLDYTPVLQLQEKDCNVAYSHDLNIYRGVVNRWTTRPKEEVQYAVQENVTLKAVTGELHLNMGVLPDQFEHAVSQIIISINVPKRLYVSDNSVSATESQVEVERASIENRNYIYNVPDDYSNPASKKPYLIKMVQLPCALSGHITVLFQDSNVPAQTYNIQGYNESPTVYIKPNVRTSLLFNGMFKQEFEVRYAGFDGSDIGVAPDEWNGGWNSLPEGSYTVDYSLSEGMGSRAALSDNLPASRRIRSLHYFLYDVDNKLVKVRTIPDISESTQWPLLRKTMTWEQREALKDTLSAGGTYTAFFVANIDKTVLGSTENAIEGDDYLEKAMLTLPETPFTDHNQFYLWKGVIKYEAPEGSTGQEDTRQYPLSKQITLRRVLSRIEMNRIAITDALINEAIDSNSAFNALLQSELKNNLNNLVGTVKDKLDAGYVANCGTLNKILTNTDNLNSLTTQQYGNYQHSLRNNVKAGADYKKRTADWSTFSASSLQIDKMQNCFSLELLKGKHVASIGNTSSMLYDLKGSTALWVGLADAESSDSESNILQGISLYKTVGGAIEATPSLQFSFDTTLKVRIPKNERRSYVCNPIASITSAPAASEGYVATVTLIVNLESVYGTLDELVSSNFVYDPLFSSVTKEEFLKTITEVANANGGWSSYNMTVHLPAPDEYQFTASVAEFK